VSAPEQFLNPSQAAKRLGVSAKALRLYEQPGLIKPTRTAAGWRSYGSAAMARAAEIAALRALGLGLAQVGRVLRGDAADLEPALRAHQAALEDRIGTLAATVENVRALRADLAQGKAPAIGELARRVRPAGEVRVAFDLPWPWGGERFELRDIRRLNYVIGPLFSGKTRLARAIAQHLPDSAFIELQRCADDAAQARALCRADRALQSRVDEILAWLVEDGAEVSPALSALIVAVESARPTNLVIDMLEHGLDHATQTALIAHLRRGLDARSLFLLTRSSAILDLAAVGPNETIILCPANHNPPTQVAPYPGAPGYEAVATCLASPEVRARTAGVIAVRPQVA
jgi:DNA-binding transcriptional MerR regulator